MTADKKITDIAEQLVEHSKIDYVGMWQLIHRVNWDIKPVDARQLKELVLQIVERLLSAGLKAITFVPSDSSAERKYMVVPWPKQDLEYVTERVASEWDALGRDPNPGEICWFM